ncbi:hypothetical protein RMN57_26735 [Kitasatospora sp. CM 4170]|uniref:Secreted protein n=1 Tax=Kitasatospora aburaviensis TaxID=67265 RepID=A0ABW1F9R6_9ACTN|nr:hypothetical protein [Kitasatospora sp. CM 4170]WNM48029.1 hypothetical protein RMN57_26735 [Kitasatospora sp. CM 4170]
MAWLNRATRTAPGRLRLAGALLAVVTVAFGTLTAWQVDGRARAAERVVSYSQPLSQAAADIHRSLADADTTAATGFLLAGAEPKAVRERYEQDLATASRLIAEAAARTTASSPAQGWLATLNQQVPVYAGLVETARANNRLGYPLGGAYLRYASDQMRTVLLPAAAQLSAAENQELADDYAAARSVPWAAYGLGVLALAVLVWVQVVLFRRTNRVFNVGLVAATAAVLSAVLWLTVAGTTADSALQRSEKRGAAPLRALNAARVDVLTARLAENLHLVARGSSTKYAELWSKTTEHLSGTDGPRDQPTGTLGEARSLAPAEAVDALVAAGEQFRHWRDQHAAATKLEVVDGDYQAALNATVAARPEDAAKTADASFGATDRKLAEAAGVELKQFQQAAEGVDGDLRTAAVAVAVLALVAAAAAVRGLGRRLAEYR